MKKKTNEQKQWEFAQMSPKKKLNASDGLLISVRKKEALA